MSSRPTCAACGASPAQVLKLRRCVGMVVAWKWYSLDQPLCRDHGREAAKSWLGQTVALGWWGLISFFANIVAVGFDLVALSQASSLPAPQRPRAGYF